MFIVRELDKTIASLAGGLGTGKDKDELGATIPDLKRVDVAKWRLASRIRQPAIRSAALDSPNRKLLDFHSILSRQRYLTTDVLFVDMMNTLFLSRVAQLPERHLTSVRLVVCDSASFSSLTKLKRVLPKLYPTADLMDNFLNKSPYDITAILLLSDLVDLFIRQQQPLVEIGASPTYNYTLIRKVFPYLKVTDLIYVSSEPVEQDLKVFDLEAPDDQQILQILHRFSRSMTIVELSPIQKQLAYFHPRYDNVVVATNNTNQSEIFMKLPLSGLTHLAERLIRVANKLRLKLGSVTYRESDPTGQTRVFAQFIINSLRAPNESVKCTNAAKVLVLDRFFDLISFLKHAQLYGSFFEQEYQPRDETGGDLAEKFKANVSRDLDDRLHLINLTDVLTNILDYANDFQLVQTEQVGEALKGSKSSALSGSQAIRLHLDMIRAVYRSLSGGYLLLAKLESSIDDIVTSLLNSNSKKETGSVVVQKFERALAAFKQLSIGEGKSIGPIDVARLASSLIDVINLYDNQQGTAMHKDLKSIRDHQLRGNELIKVLKEVSVDEDPKHIAKRVDDFQKISKETSSKRSNLSLEQIIDKFFNNNLDKTQFSTLQLPKSLDGETYFILVFLGHLSHYELARIKSVEKKITSGKANEHQRLILLSYCISKPDYLFM